VRTRHAGPVTWFVFQMRDLFDGWLDGGNKYGFYELLAQGALEHRASREIGGFVNVKVNVKEGCRLQATGYGLQEAEGVLGKGTSTASTWRAHDMSRN